MDATDTLRAGQEAYARGAWAQAYAALTSADAHGLLEAEDHDRLAVASYLTGRDRESHAAFERAHRAYLDAGQPLAAARCAFWLGWLLVDLGEDARGGGWFARVERLVEQAPGSAEEGYLRIRHGRVAAESGRTEEAFQHFRTALEAGERSQDHDLMAFGRLGLGLTAIARGDNAAGLAMLDEVMLSVEAGDVSPVPAGILYCVVIGACRMSLDYRRARDWVTALTAWCEAQPELVPYRGQCLIHRSEIFELQGRWNDALEAARRARDFLAGPPVHPAVGHAWYQQAELHRLRGELDAAEEAYRQASRLGHPPLPGLARLRLAQGQADLAVAAIARGLDEGGLPPPARAELLAVAVEAALATGDLADAAAACEELSSIAEAMDVELLTAMRRHAEGAVALAEGDPATALRALRRAEAGWRAVDAPYEAARTRVLLARACAELDDRDGARLELDAARAAFESLGAQAELSALDAVPVDRAAPPSAAGLTDREIEVLRLVARGGSNREIAGELFISEHTVARHVQNIFAKIDVTSRTAAAAFAYEHDLV